MNYAHQAKYPFYDITGWHRIVCVVVCLAVMWRPSLAGDNERCYIADRARADENERCDIADRAPAGENERCYIAGRSRDGENGGAPVVFLRQYYMEGSRMT